MNSLDFAVKMELEGQKYYMEQAGINKGNSLDTIFLMLAKDEGKHADILQDKIKEAEYELEGNNTLSVSKSIFNNIGDYKDGIREIPRQLDLYRTALDKEKQSIDLYIDFLSNAADEKEKKLFQYLIKQEKEHYLILEEIVILLTRPDEWVESAEFGVREEY